jgi:hypothetical protein
MANPFRLRAAALTTTAVLLSAVLAGCGGSGEDGDLTAQKLDWKDCPAPSEAEGGGSPPSPLPNGAKWQCATMKAPLDWSRPKGDTVGIAMIRAQATGPASRRIGSLVFNFGGPGDAGTDDGQIVQSCRLQIGACQRGQGRHGRGGPRR